MCIVSCKNYKNCLKSQWCGLNCYQFECYDNSECNSPKEVCQYGFCTVVKPCNNNHHCPTGYYCRGPTGKMSCTKMKSDCSKDICQKGESCVTVEDNEGSGDAETCLKDIKCYSSIDCPVDMFCYTMESVCRPRSCKHKTCPRGSSCFKGICTTNSNCYDTGDCYTNCTMHSDCPYGKICYESICIHFECKEDNDCPSNQKCIHGKCYKKDPTCKELCNCKCTGNCYNNKCVEPICRHNSDCVYPANCIRETCVQPECDKCPPNHSCKELGFCERNPTPPPVNICTTSPECPYGLPCVEKQCKRVSCHYDNECGWGKFCSDGTCIYVDRCTQSSYTQSCLRGRTLNDKSCRIDKDCTEGYSCEIDVCIPYNVMCRSYSDCTELTKCINKRCQLNVCTKDIDCGDRRECVDKLCVPRLICQANEDCPSGKKCKNSRCVDNCGPYNCDYGLKCNSKTDECEPSGKCDEHHDCPSGYLCINAKCEVAECTPRYGCSTEKICSFGRCVDICTTIKCQKGWKCNNGLCIPDSVDITCKNECAWPYKCVNGKCKNICFSNNDCEYPSSYHKFECKEETCQVPKCNGICEKPSNICQEKVCKQVECLKDEDCPYSKMCFLGVCIIISKETQCSKDKILEPTLLQCLPKEYVKIERNITVTPPSIYCTSTAHCPSEMECRKSKKLCEVTQCPYPVSDSDESAYDFCKTKRLCVATTTGSMCIPAFECDYGDCSHPQTPESRIFKCHSTLLRCYVSQDECNTDEDCKENYKCRYSIRKKKKVCEIEICTGKSDCPEESTCFNSKCQICAECKTNSECFDGQICVKNCCVNPPDCKNDCNKLFEEKSGDFCYAGKCFICYENKGKDPF